jgi:hypothetical protein
MGNHSHPLWSSCGVAMSGLALSGNRFSCCVWAGADGLSPVTNTAILLIHLRGMCNPGTILNLDTENATCTLAHRETNFGNRLSQSMPVFVVVPVIPECHSTWLRISPRSLH